MQAIEQSQFFNTKQVGEHFLAYYRELGYLHIQGGSLLDASLPMSFVMSAGMVQFEKLTGRKRDSDSFVLIQNCFRYFDLVQIGRSDTHLSLFQMAGAFEFGPVNRLRTIHQIWTLLTDGYAFDPASLVVTYFNGGESDGHSLLPDLETAFAWQSQGLPAERIIGMGVESNFWRQTSLAVGHANSRKRGANTEVFYDRGAQYGCGQNCLPGCACGRYVEFLNTLFITHQFDEQTGRLISLAEPFTEVVIGIERVAMILQDAKSVFDIDSLAPSLQQLRCFSKPLPSNIEGIAIEQFERVLVDHLRALLFLTADGAPPPGKGGQARLMRMLIREMLTSQRLLGISDPGFVCSMLMSIIKFFPQLAAAQHLLLKYLAEENERFERTLQIAQYDLEIILEKGDQQISDEDIAILQTKHGLPLPLLRYRLWQKRISNIQPEYPIPNPFVVEKKTLELSNLDVKKLKKMQTTDGIIQVFLNTFRCFKHEIIPGSSLVDDSLPMSFVMSAGLVQVERAAVATIQDGQHHFALKQNCFRHFDLDKIGASSTHLSLFRMLGAFHFGAIDKREQINTAWLLATRTYHLSPDKLWITYFGGDTIAGHQFDRDEETFQLWRESGIRLDHLISMGGENNFWKQSDMVVGAEHAPKCGPNTEIFFDRGEQLSCSPDCWPGCGCGRFVEFLNMLFITWSMNEKSDTVCLLERPFTETVVGAERLAMILQGSASVYEIDSVFPLVLYTREFVQATDLSAMERLRCERILVDHLRALVFLAADGAPSPGKGGRAFLIRRLTRELLVSQELLGIRESSFLPELIEKTAQLYRESHPRLDATSVVLLHAILQEKSRFEHTMRSGFRQIEHLLQKQPSRWLSGQDVLELEKEYGLPLPLLERFLNKQKISYHPKAYQAASELRKLDT